MAMSAGRRIELVVQPNNWSCYAAVAVMITGESLEAFYRFVGHDGSAVVRSSLHADGRRGFTFCEVAQYLASRGFLLGSMFDLRGVQPGREKFEVCLRYDSRRPGIVFTRGRTYNHVIFWTGDAVFDPSPAGPRGESLDAYECLAFWEVHQVRQRKGAWDD